MAVSNTTDIIFRISTAYNTLLTQFVSDFPTDKISNMNIDDYVFGKVVPNVGKPYQHTFCYRLEYGSKGFGGIRGTPNDKFGIYCDKKTQNYIYDKDKYSTTEQAFNAIKSQLETMLQAGKQFAVDKDWIAYCQTLEGEYDIHRHVRSNILADYYPEEFLAMHSDKAAHNILESLFGISRDLIEKGLFLKQAKLLELKNSDPIMNSVIPRPVAFFIQTCLCCFRV